MFKDVEDALMKKYSGYKFKIVKKEDTVEIVNNYEDKIGDEEFINDVLDIYESKIEGKNTLLPIVVYDFFDEIDSLNTTTELIKYNQKEFESKSIKVNTVTFFEGDSHKVKISLDNKITNIKSSSKRDYYDLKWNMLRAGFNKILTITNIICSNEKRFTLTSNIL